MTITIGRIFAPASILTCACMISILFIELYGVMPEAPAIANPRFKYWTRDPVWNFTKPLMWEVSLLLGPKDRGFIRRDVVDGMICLGMHVYQDGANDAHDWATVHVRQNLRGKAVKQLFQGTSEIWVYPTFRHQRYRDSGHPENVFGVEINNGTNLLWIIFSEEPDQVYQIQRHLIVIINTPLNTWSHREVRIGNYYSDAGWTLPSEVALIFLVGATKGTPGEYAGFFQEIKVVSKGLSQS